MLRATGSSSLSSVSTLAVSVLLTASSIRSDDNTDLNINGGLHTVGGTAPSVFLGARTAGVVNAIGGQTQILGGAGNGSGAGGAITLRTGDGGFTGNGGSILIHAADGGAGAGTAGGDIVFDGGGGSDFGGGLALNGGPASSAAGVAGSVFLTAGSASGGGTHGDIVLSVQGGGIIPFQVNGSGMMALTVTSTVSASAGGSLALPLTPEGYLTVIINGTVRKMPYYPV